MDFLELCRKLIALDTTPGQGTGKAAHWVAELARERGFHAQVRDEELGGVHQANLIVRLDDRRPDQEFLFQTHLDTADPGPFALWKQTGQNPFDAHIQDQAIYGLGTADCKLDLLCKLEAFTRFAQVSKTTARSFPPVIVASFGEEHGMQGALRLIRKNDVASKAALVGEPSNLQIFLAGMGFARVTIRIPFEPDELDYREEHNLRESSSTVSKSFKGVAAHSSVPHLGENAITKMFEYLAQLPEDLAVMEIDGGVNANTVAPRAFLEIDPCSGFRFSMAKKLNILFQKIQELEHNFLKYSDEDFFPKNPTLNLGSIRTSQDEIEIQSSVRIPPSITNEIYEDWMRKFSEACAKIGGEVKVADYKRPYRTFREAPVARWVMASLETLGLDAKVSTHSSTNEASLFSRVGIDCVSFGPGVRDGNIHTPNEHVKIKDLETAILFYSDLMQRVCR